MKMRNADSGMRNKKPELSTAGDRFEKALDAIRENVGKAGDKEDKGEDDTRERDAIKAKRADIESADVEFKKEFSATEKKLRDAKLPKEILDRHYKFVKHYENNLKELKTNLDDIEQAKTGSDRKAKIEKARLHLEKTKKPSTHQKLDPNNLPFKARTADKTREPRLKKEEFEKDFPPQKKANKLASLQAISATDSHGWTRILNSAFRNPNSALGDKPILVASNGSLDGLLSSDKQLPLPSGDKVGSAPEWFNRGVRGGFNSQSTIRNPQWEALNLAAVATADAPTTADLAQTPEVQFTEAITAKALELGYNPVNIYEYVRNNITFIPTYGSIQGADQCLRTKQCNAYDAASLLIALLRVSNISARYTYGTIEVTAEKIMNWAGGFTDPNAAVELIASGGTPVHPIISGGVITAVRMEHLWVEAWIDYFPSRGARHKVGDSWIQLDPSFKQHVNTPGIGLTSAVPFDSDGFLQQIRSSAVINEPESNATGVDCSDLQQTMDSFRAGAESYLGNHYPNVSVGEVLGKQDITKQEFPYLLGTLPYKTIVVGQKMSGLSDMLRHKYEIVITNSGVDDIRVVKNLAEVAGRKITVSYAPATQADRDVINRYMPAAHVDGSPVTLSELPSSLPAYLINVKPEFRIDGALIATGAAIGLGQVETLTTVFTRPDQEADRTPRTITAGEYYALATDTGGSAATLSSLEPKLDATRAGLGQGDLTNLTKEDILGDALYGVALSSLTEQEMLTAVRAKTAGVVSLRLPAAFIASTNANVTSLFGLPRSMGLAGLETGAPSGVDLIQSVNGNRDKQKQFALASGLEAAALVGAASQDLFAASGVAVSTVTALVAAKDQGMPIYTVNQGNIATVLPKLQLESEQITDIQNAVNAGLVVVVPKANITVNSWTGSGWLVIDPATGSVVPLLSGGVSGAVVQGLAWTEKAMMLGLAGNITAPIADLSSAALSESFIFAAKSIAAGARDLASSVATTYLPLITSGYYLQASVSELDCYLNGSASTAAPSGPCMADLLGGLCVANSVSVFSTANSRPIANAGPGRTVNIGDLVTLDGSGSSDADNDLLTYSWSLVSKPDKSRLILSNANLAQLSFVVDVAGTYRIRLIVSDGKSYSNPADVVVTAGYDMVTVPNLSNKTQQDAELAIIAAELRVGSITAQSSGTVPSGSVISQNPQANAVLPKGSSVELTVSSGPSTDTEPPTLDVSFNHSAGIYDLGENVIVTITTSDNAGAPTVAMTVDGVNKTVTLPDTIISTATYSAGSNHTIAVTATDSASNKTTKTLVFGITDQNQTVIPDINITSPAADAEISAPTPIIGTVTTPNLLKYTLSYAPVGSTAFTTLTVGTSPITNGTLGTLDPTLLKNGIYDIRLTATDTNGKSTYMDVTYRVKGDMKVGNFTVTFTDLSIPVTGIPITVNRTYDSRDKASRDFGIGWTVDIQSTKLDENRTPGEGWPQVKQGGAFGSYCIQGDTEHYVSVNLPDGRTEEFDIVLTPDCQRLSPVEQTAISYAPRFGTTSTLALKNPVLLLVAGGYLIDPDTGAPYDTSGYLLKTVDGMVYDIDQSFGIRSVTDTNGNRLTYSSSGITHSAGKGVVFTRDSNGRITKITAPDNSAITYAYDTDGNLASMTDLAGNVTKYSYNRSHGLTDIKDPRGITPIKNEYDESGRLVAHTDSFGKRIEYTHDIAGRQEVVKDRNGNLTVFIYDEKGRVLQRTDPQGNTTTITYDAVGNKLSETDPLGNSTAWTYDSKKNVLSETKTIDGQTITTSHTYNSLGKVLTTTDPLGHVTTNTYDTKGNLLTTRDALGNTTTNVYDAKGNIKTTTDALGNTATYEYDAFGNRTKQTTATGSITTFTYDTKGNKLTETDPKGNTTTYTYDANGKPLTVTNTEGNVTKYEYDKAGNKVAEVNALGLITWYYYDSANRLVETEHPDGTIVKAGYDNEGNRVTSTDQLGRLTTNTYNANKQLIKTTYVDGSTRQFGYDSAGRQETTTDALGNVTTKEYDALGRVSRSIDPEGNTTTFEYDLAGNQIKQTDPNNNATTFAYDDGNRLTTTTLPGGQATTIAYDTLGRKISETDATGNKTRFDYDAQGNLIKVTGAMGGVTQYEYDQNSSRTAIIDARGNKTAFAFDKLNRPVSKTMPNGGIETYAYDAAGRQITKIDAKGRKVQYAYDSSSRLTTRLYPDNTTAKFTYTATGKRAAATDNRGTTNYAYDTRDRLTKHTYPDNKAINYTYDLNGRISTLSSLAGTITYGYSGSGRLAEVKDPAGNTTTYDYDNAGNRTGLAYPNGTSVSYTYDTNNRLTNLAHKNSLADVLASYAYTLGAIGNRTKIDEANGISRQYQYDKLYRLTGEQVADPANTQTYQNDFTYDAVGNRLNKTYTAFNQSAVSNDYTYNTADQLVTENGITYTYDLNGNLASKTDSTGTTTYTYNYEDRLVQVRTPNSELVTYKYDADNNRVSSTTTAGTTKYLVDTNRSLAQVLSEYSTAGDVAASYVYADDLISMNRSGVVSYYHFDGLGSTRLLTDVHGAVTDTYQYDAFGNQIARTGTTVNEFLFTGQQYDANVGFYYLRARYYQPETGRFGTHDPIEGDIYAPASLHKYVYSVNDPVNRIDPSGETSLGEMSINLAIRATLFTIRHPYLMTIVGFVASALMPEDAQMALMNSGWPGASAVGGAGNAQLRLFRLIKSERIMSMLKSGNKSLLGKFWHELGYGFENCVKKYLLQNKAKGPVKLAVGNHTADALYNDIILEIKSGGISPQQLNAIATTAKMEGTRFAYLFLNKPSNGTINTIVKAGGNVFYIFD